MFAGVALALSELPVELIERHGLERRIRDRGGEREVQFLFADAERRLPVWRERPAADLALGQPPRRESASALHGLDAAGHHRERRLGRAGHRAGRHPGDDGPGQGRLVSHPPGHPRLAGPRRARLSRACT